MPVDTALHQETNQGAAEDAASQEDQVDVPTDAPENESEQPQPQQQDMSDRRREKMPDYSASSQVEQE